MNFSIQSSNKSTSYSFPKTWEDPLTKNTVIVQECNPETNAIDAESRKFMKYQELTENRDIVALKVRGSLGKSSEIFIVVRI